MNHLDEVYLFKEARIVYAHVGLFCICYRGSNIDFLAIYRVNRILELPPFCIQLEQAYDKRLLWKYQCILSVSGNNQPAC